MAGGVLGLVLETVTHFVHGGVSSPSVSGNWYNRDEWGDFASWLQAKKEKTSGFLYCVLVRSNIGQGRVMEAVRRVSKYMREALMACVGPESHIENSSTETRWEECR